MFDAESKSVLHTEMAKKNLFVKRGELSFTYLKKPVLVYLRCVSVILLLMLIILQLARMVVELSVVYLCFLKLYTFYFLIFGRLGEWITTSDISI